ncbi:hypothetical protein HOD08_02505 [bacterium]|nr:hypothetical protein [bacterium]
MNQNLTLQVKVFGHLMHREMIALSKVITDFVINAAITSPLFLFVFAKIIMIMGTSASHIPIIIAGEISVQALFLGWGEASALVTDLNNRCECQYLSRIPISPRLAFLKYTCASIVKSFIVGTVVLVATKIALWDVFCLAQFSIPKFFLAMILNSTFYGIVATTIAARSKNLDQVTSMFMRCVFPLWMIIFLGPWHMLATASPTLGTIALFSPITYTMEAVRGAILGQEGFINFWTCIGVGTTATIFLGILGLHWMKKRLDHI